MTRLQKTTLAAVASILVYQLLLPPIVGLADQGDYARVIGHFGFGPTVKEFNDRYYFFVNRTYTHDATFKTPGWESFTSQYVLIGSALLVNKLLSKDGMLDLRVLGSIHILIFLAATFFILRASGRLVSLSGQCVISLALVLMFCDVGYVSYFNSFFTEPASYLFLLAVLAVWLDLIANDGPSLRHTALFAACGSLFVTAKPQNFVAGLVLALYMLRFRRLMRAPRWAVPACSLILGAASLFIYLNTPKQMKQAAAYDMVFMTIIPGSPDPVAQLRAFGLDPGQIKYSGTAAYSPNTGFWYPEFQREFAKHISQFTILWFYVSHPARFVKVIWDILPRSVLLRAEFSANFEKSAGYPPFTKSRSFAAWSRFRQRWLSRWAILVVAFPLVSAPVSLWLALKAQTLRGRLCAECYGILTLMTALTFFTTLMGDSLDVVKHLFLYNVLTDICLTFAIASGVMWMSVQSRSKWGWARLPFDYFDRDRRKTAQTGLQLYMM